MSNFLAIATVTATLSQILQAAVSADVPGAIVTKVRPDSLGSGTPAPGVNIYLYQTTPNVGWRNADLPNRRPDGQFVQRPQVALDLHYLLTFCGDDTKLEPQRLLGCVVRTLHAHAFLTRQMIRDTILNAAFQPFVGGSDLAEDVELVKFTPTSLSLEELSRVWSVFFQTPYTLSVAYQASVVLIQSEETSQTSLPVRARNIYVTPFRQPIIEKVISQAGPDQPIFTGSTLIILGKQLLGDVTLVRIGGVEVTLAPENVSENQISLPLPSGLRAGVQALQVIHQMLMGTPPVPHRGVESNVAAFVLRPTITSGSATRSEVKVNLDLPVWKRQRVVLLLNEFNPPANRPAWAYRFDALSTDVPGAPETTTVISIPISAVEAGKYLVRVQVDGSESPLTADTDPASLTYGQYIRPKVTIP